MRPAGTPLSSMNVDGIGKFFVVDGVSKTLDGLEVKVSNITSWGTAEVSVIRRQGLLIGDRAWQEAVFPGSMHVAVRCLRLSAQQDEMEFSSKSDFGKHVNNSSVTRNNLALFWSRYENAVSIDLNDISAVPTKKLFPRVFYDKKRIDAAIDLCRSFLMLTTSVTDIEKELRGIA